MKFKKLLFSIFITIVLASVFLFSPGAADGVEIPEETEETCDHTWVNGVCSVCSESCTHNINQTFYYLHAKDNCFVCIDECTICDYENYMHMPHDYDDSGVCTNCKDTVDTECSHHFAVAEEYIGTSSECYARKYLCIYCEYQYSDISEHDFYNGSCLNCLMCNHDTLISDVCGICGYDSTCEHNFESTYTKVSTADTCMICIEKCTLCGSEEREIITEHDVDENGVCLFCQLDTNTNCVHDIAFSQIIVGTASECVNLVEACTKCDYKVVYVVFEHDFENGYCSFCNLSLDDVSIESETENVTESETEAFYEKENGSKDLFGSFILNLGSLKKLYSVFSILSLFLTLIYVIYQLSKKVKKQKIWRKK